MVDIVDDHGGRLRFAPGSRQGGHPGQFSGIDPQVVDPFGQERTMQLFLFHHQGRPFIGQRPGIQYLMVVCRLGKRYEENRFAHGGNFRHRGGSGPADDQVGPVVAGGHVEKERFYFVANTGLGIGLGHRVPISVTRLVDKQQSLRIGQGFQRRTHRGIDAVRALAAAGHQDGKGSIRAALPVRWGQKLLPDGVARKQRPPGVPRQAGLFEREINPPGNAGQQPVGDARQQVLFMQHHRDPAQPGGQCHRT